MARAEQRNAESPVEALTAQQAGAGSRTEAANGAPQPPGNHEMHVARGIMEGRGARATRGARVAFARPNVDRGPAATTAAQTSERVRDSVDTELLAAQLQRSFVDTSVQRSERRGNEAGGIDRAGPGLDREGAGLSAHALPYLPGPGEFGALDTRDARYLRWFVAQRARVQHELVFPRPRALAKDQGTCVYRVEVLRDGTLRSAPKLIRSSGFSDFDAAAIAAITRAAPFEPLPAALAPEMQRLSLLIPVAFENPMVE
jgi:TonB family protein